MADSKGKFVWFELMTTDTKSAIAFYEKAVGWTGQPMPMPGMEYNVFLAGGEAIGGVLPLSDEARKMGAVTGWVGYVAVDDVDAAANEIKGKGGAIHHPPTDIPTVGRFAVVADPQGAAIALFKPASAEMAPSIDPRKPGHIGWHELYTNGDHKAALAFYAGQFGWTAGEAMDMGPMGTYQIFNRDGQMYGGMMNKPAEAPVGGWLYYFNVGNIDEAAGRVTSAGGQVLMGPMEVPGPMWILQCVDPQGGRFALVGSK